MKTILRPLLLLLLISSCAHQQQTLNLEGYVDFLYGNLSLPDRNDYPREYYVEQTRLALQARAEMPWGKSVPERKFRHFVLPPRVNNEDLDSCRALFFRELQPRLKGLSMAQAILEVNHWCHEKVTYRPTNARTLSPLATVRTAYGRCGEESVFTVAALRSVGIPARQVYTPRWAHTDDNHAWVEAWADGQWHFLGACEPEPILDMGWFNESASRGMLMHTRVFGDYDGPEEVVSSDYGLTEINVTDIYAPTRSLTVLLRDSLDRPVEDATVEFKLYNYAEFYTVARKQTDAQGRVVLTAGLGDMLIWATAGSTASGRQQGIAFRQVSFASDSLVTLHLTDTLASTLAAGLPLDITPPAVSASLPAVSAEQRAENDRRLAQEDCTRHAYDATMTDQRSRGNHETIAAFRDSAAARGTLSVAEELIATLPDKDLQDVTLPILLDNLPSTAAPTAPAQDLPSSIRRPYVLSPRIERERLTAFKQPLRKAFQDFSIDELIVWTRDSLQLITDQNPRHLRMLPLGVYRTRKADELGRDIFFVAACRSNDIAARINEINGKVQYYDTSLSTWHDVSFDDTSRDDTATRSTLPQGTLQLTYTPAPHLPDAKYYVHFTLSRLDDNQQLQLLTYPEEATFQNTFAAGTSLDAGTYLLTTGIRMANGSVRTLLRSFTITADSTTTVPLELRAATDAVAVIGSLNAENLYLPLTTDHPSQPQTDSPTSLLSTCGRGYYLLGLVAPNQEPTNHALRDIALVRDDLEAWGRHIVLLFEAPSAAARFNFKEFTPDGSQNHTQLPSTVSWGCDIQGTIRKEIIEQLHLTSSALPIFLICDSFNRVVFVQQGYTIGLGEQLMKIIHQL